VKVGFFQFSPILGRKDENVERAISSLRGARADLLVLPELFSTGYLFGNELNLFPMVLLSRNWPMRPRGRR
jgi:predicted amidohydrolase